MPPNLDSTTRTLENPILSTGNTKAPTTTSTNANKLFPNVHPDDPDFFTHDSYSQFEKPSNKHASWTGQKFPHESQLKDNEYIFTNPIDGTKKLLNVNVNTFYKIKWNNKCSKEMDIFHFYESLQHMASTCGIPMRDLCNIDENNGVCPLSKDNCLNYDKVYKYMKGAIFHKINDSHLWTNYDHGWNLVQSNLSDCDGFEVMNDVLAEILPKLNINTAKCTKIPCPHYADMEDDNIYSYILAYNSFLKFEELGPHKRTYSPYEIAVYISSDLEKDPNTRFEKGIDYVRQQLQRSPDGLTVS